MVNKDKRYCQNSNSTSPVVGFVTKLTAQHPSHPSTHPPTQAQRYPSGDSDEYLLTFDQTRTATRAHTLIYHNVIKQRKTEVIQN